MKKCNTKYCRNEIIPSRDGRYCSTCRNRKHRKNSPYKYFFAKLKNSAKRRGKEFTLTLQDFKDLWKDDPEKWKEKIAGPDNCTWEVDRIREEEGYHSDNIQLLKKRKNIQKYFNHKNQFQIDVTWEEDRELDPPDAPF